MNPEKDKRDNRFTVDFILVAIIFILAGACMTAGLIGYYIEEPKLIHRAVNGFVFVVIGAGAAYIIRN